MKNFGVVALSGAALLQVASASCCRSNKCFRAVALADFEGVEDCKSNLIVTVTPSASVSTYTETVTLVQSAIDTVFFTETTTEIASTETRILTETTTVTAATETDFLTEIVTVPYTTTLVSLLPEVTSTATIYQDPMLTMKKLKARDTLTQISEADPLPTLEASTSTNDALPTYATLECRDWAQYSKACKCVGVTATTITASSPSTPVETVTVTASDAFTTVISTLSSTSTDIISLTETVSDVETTIIGATDLVTATTTLITSAAVETVLATSTPVSVVPLTCKPRQMPFRASTPFPDGSTRWMNSVSNTIIAWQSFAPGTSGPGLYSSTWQLDASGGWLEHVNVLPGQTQVFAAYVDATATKATVQVLVKPKSEVEAGVSDGRWARVKGCVNAQTGALSLSIKGRQNTLSCGNGLYVSSGDGKDVRSDCLTLSPIAA